MTIREVHLTNGAYGFPAGRARRVSPIALACIHVTGNKNTASHPDLHAAAMAERNYANREGSTTSAHYYIARDGWAVEAVDPVRYAAWSNGVVREPNRANPGILDVLAMRAKGANANEAYVLEVECLGYSTSYPITAAQKNLVAELIAAHATRTALPISRSTVHGHWELNGVDRRNCPVPYAGREAFLKDVIARAKALMPTKEDPMYSIPGQLSAVAPAGTPYYSSVTDTTADGKTGASARYELVAQSEPTKKVNDPDPAKRPARVLVDGAGSGQGKMSWLPAAALRDFRSESFNDGVAAAAAAAATAKR